MGSAQNPDIFFQAREAANGYYNAMPSLVESYMEMINRKIGTDYGLFRYYGANDADHVIIAMGSVCETVKETIDYLMDGKGSGDVRPGLVEVHLYRPFSAAHLLSVLPESVRQITVPPDKRTGRSGRASLSGCGRRFKEFQVPQRSRFSGRYGLSSKDTDPSQIYAVFRNRRRRANRFLLWGLRTMSPICPWISGNL